jgi:hypothetical protein
MCLLFGGILAVDAAYNFLKNSNLLEMVMLLSFCAAFTSLGLLALMGLVAREWLRVSGNAVIGIMFIWSGISGLHSPPSASYPRWTQWAWLVIGVWNVLWPSFMAWTTTIGDDNSPAALSPMIKRSVS